MKKNVKNTSRSRKTSSTIKPDDFPGHIPPNTPGKKQEIELAF